MENKSIWLEEYENKTIKKVRQNIEVDIAIVGGGMTGLHMAYFLKDTPFTVALFEQNKVGLAVSARTTGKITCMQENLLSRISKLYNKETAKKYYQSQKLAISLLKDIIRKEKIACDFRKCPNYLFTQNEKGKKKIQEEFALLKLFNENVEEVNYLPDGRKVCYGIKQEESYVFHPIRYMCSLKNSIEEKLPIYESSRVTKIEREDSHFVLTINDFKVIAKKVILCTHYPYFLFPYLMPLKCSLEKSLLCAYEEDTKTNFSAITVNKPILSIRYKEGVPRYKIVLSHSRNLSFIQEKEDMEVLKKGNVDYAWTNIDILTKDFMPYIGSIGDSLYLATGYNTWGMTNSVLAGKIVRDILVREENEYIDLFSPRRKGNLKTIIKYPLYLVNSAYSFANTKIIKNKSWYPSNVEFTEIDGVSVGIYTDAKGKKHIVRNKCPHLGCSLLFNTIDHTWDCPCHGSRFDLDGGAISGPSNYDIHF